MHPETTTTYRLPLFSLIVIVISFVIGMGIFKLPASVAATSGTPTIFYLAWIVGGLTALMGGLVYAEIGLRLPTTGGYYQIFATCYHPAVGFTVNMLILISNAASVGIVALIGADYVSDLLYGAPAGQAFNIGVALLSVGLFYGVNLLGLKTSAGTQNFLMVLKVGLVILLISAIFTGQHVLPHGYDSQAAVYAYNGSNGFTLFLISLVSVSFAYGGYQQTINFGGEAKNSASIPSAIIWGTVLVLVLYLSISVVYVQVIGFDAMKNATAIGALLCEAWFGTAGAKVFDICMFLSVLAYVNICLLGNPRAMYAMSQDGALPAVFANRNPKTGAYTAGLTVFAVATVFIVFMGKGVDAILSFTMFLDSIGMITSACTLFILRRRQQHDPERQAAVRQTMPMLSRITPLMTVLFSLMYVAIAIAVVLKDPMASVIAVGLLLFFVMIYFVFKTKTPKT